MKNLSLSISQMNSLKQKLLKFSEGISNSLNNIMQNQKVKLLTEEELNEFKKFFYLIKNEDAHFEVLNISIRRIKILVLFSKQETIPYSNGETEAILVKKIISLRNLF